MQKMFVFLTTTVLFGLGVCALAQAEPSAATALPTLYAEMWIIPVREKPEPIRTLVVTLINTTDKPITVVTEKLNQETSEDRGGDTVTLTLGLSVVAKKEGKLVVPSLPKLAPVELLPGEAANIPVETGNDSLFARKLASGKTLTKVTYAVTEFWGQRLKVWRGEVMCDVTVHDMATTKPATGKAGGK